MNTLIVEGLTQAEYQSIWGDSLLLSPSRFFADVNLTAEDRGLLERIGFPWQMGDFLGFRFQLDIAEIQEKLAHPFYAKSPIVKAPELYRYIGSWNFFQPFALDKKKGTVVFDSLVQSSRRSKPNHLVVPVCSGMRTFAGAITFLFGAYALVGGPEISTAKLTGAARKRVLEKAARQVTTLLTADASEHAEEWQLFVDTFLEQLGSVCP